MAHDAGKGAKPRPFSVTQEEYRKNLQAILDKRLVVEDEDDASCKACGGPMYTQILWRYSYCDDCGKSVKKEPMEP